MVVSKIIRHPAFDRETLHNDIALLRLYRSIVYTAYIQPICLPRDTGTVPELNPCYISGWGAMETNGPSSDTLQEAEVNLISNEVCNQEDWYDGIITYYMQCAGYEGGLIDGCQ
ncbi:transmembrane protease serine 3-like, partial [Rhincodon typus]|uniref:transmembrane protease serine 3-like n=1 Tax=Rhincodon typus TaxID=259920 RepID=UPI00202FF0B3